MLIYFVWFIKTTHPVYSSEFCQGQGSIQKFIKIIFENNPDLKLQDQGAKEALTKIEVAKQRINPEFDFDIQKDISGSEDALNAETSIKHTFELGGKRESRIYLAEIEAEEVRVQEVGSKEQLIFESILNLFKLKYLKEQKELYNEGIHTYTDIISRLKNRKGLNPEQKVSLTTFEIALQEYKIKINQFSNQIEEIENYFKFVMNGKCNISDIISPSEIKNWPNFSSSEKEISNQYSQIITSNTQIKAKEANLQLEKSNSIPDLKIGPVIGSSFEDGKKDVSIGLALTMDLPLFGRNEGGRSYAASLLEGARQKAQQTKFQVELEREKYLNLYQTSLKNISNYGAIKHLNEKHRDIDFQFKEGIISSSLILEVHRQLIDHSSSLQESKIDALKAMLKLYAMNGKILEVNFDSLL